MVRHDRETHQTDSRQRQGIQTEANQHARETLIQGIATGPLHAKKEWGSFLFAKTRAYDCLITRGRGNEDRFQYQSEYDDVDDDLPTKAGRAAPPNILQMPLKTGQGEKPHMSDVKNIDGKKQ